MVGMFLGQRSNMSSRMMTRVTPSRTQVLLNPSVDQPEWIGTKGRHKMSEDISETRGHIVSSWR